MQERICRKQSKNKKETAMRSALKDTAQRNKSLTGFVKCTLCVKFAFSE